MSTLIVRPVKIAPAPRSAFMPGEVGNPSFCCYPAVLWTAGLFVTLSEVEEDHEDRLPVEEVREEP